MVFNSIDFLLFFPIVVIVTFLLPKRIRYIWLLLCSYYFYMCWNPRYALLLVLSTISTFLGGVGIEKARQKYIKKSFVFFTFFVNLLILGLFKYANFFLVNISLLMGRLNLTTVNYRFDFLLPVGISFYTFQALGYIIDVYRGNIKAEKNILKYALFVSFFPQLVAGPIERSTNLLSQIDNLDKECKFNIKNIYEGLALMCWGFFEKLVIADRISIFVNTVYENYVQYGFVEITLATILFAVQIYCDFGGYTDIARGTARILGVRLQNNFRQPYFAVSIKDFWRRWHVSLTSWFTDYLYIPLGGGRKGVVRKYLNIIIVFLVSGLWHGARWNFIAWGLLHAVFQVVGDIKNKGIKYKNKNMEEFGFSRRLRKSVGTFILVDFAWLFFASKGLRTAFAMIKVMCSHFMSGNLLNMGLSSLDWIVLTASLILLLIIDLMHERGLSWNGFVSKQESWFVGLGFSLAIWAIIIFGIYGEDYAATEFIYFQF